MLFLTEMTYSSIVIDMSKESFSIDISGLKSKEVIDRINKNAEQLLKQACILVQDDAKRNCPVDTGRLQGSIQYEVKENDGMVGTNVEYAPYVHEGTSRMRGRPFLRDAGEKNKGKITELFKEGLVK